MTNEKITKRAMLLNIIDMMNTGESVYAPADVIAFCEREIELIDHKNAKAKERAATKAKEADALQEAVAAVLGSDFEPIADIAARVDHPDATVAKIAYRLSALAKANVAEKSEITIPATETSKARKVVAYKAITD